MSENQPVKTHCRVEYESNGTKVSVDVSYEIAKTLCETQNADRNAQERDRYHGVLSADAAYRGISGDSNASHWDALGGNLAAIQAHEEDAREKEIREVAYELLDEALANLRAEDVRVVHSLFFDGLTLRACGELLGVSHTAVRKRRTRIIRELYEQILAMVESLDEDQIEELSRLYDIGVCHE
ncbi:MAG: ECF-type sigma factor [Gordonibacter sp.]|uniref:ECF-type sigma factor n=1 Tax=Gordonibacter sp. TaxID=1968902 RepID=UPI002B3C494A|nr:ECF-type sigma factor [Gordonibacter sp.]